MSAAFAYVDHEHNKGIELYFEDDRIAFNTWERRAGRLESSHELMLDVATVDALILGLTKMKSTILKPQLAITAKEPKS